MRITSLIMLRSIARGQGEGEKKAPATVGRRGSGWVFWGKSAVLAFVDHDKPAAAIAPDTQQRGFVLGLLGQMNGLIRVFHSLTVDLDNHIAGAQPRFGRGGIGIHVR